MDDIKFSAFLAHLDHIPRLQEIGRNVHHLAVNQEMAMADDLTSGSARWCEPEAIDHIIEPPFEQLHQRLARPAGLTQCLLKIISELFFPQSVLPADLLLLPKLNSVLRSFRTTKLSVLTRGIVAPFNRALLGKALRSLEKKFLPLPAAQPAYWSYMSSHTILG